jgi:hypothetical protein
MPLEPELPETEVAYETFKARFGAESVTDDAPFTQTSVPVDLAVTGKISLKEVTCAQRAFSAKSASGPDKAYSATFVKSVAPVLWKTIFQSFMTSKRVPVCLKANRTILLPKGPTGLEDISRWRPLSIGSTVLRLYTKILAKRLNEGTEFDIAQKAFVGGDGVSENIVLVDTLLDKSVREKQDLHVVFLDLSKAFDMVSHRSVERAMRRFQAPQQLIDIVADLYTGATTTVKGRNGPSGVIELRTGVKQGDALSPVLFNMVLDELWSLLPKESGTSVLGSWLAGLGFADDSVLVSSSAAGMRNLLKITERFFKARGLMCNGSKSHSISIQHIRSRQGGGGASGRASAELVNGNFAYDGERIPAATTEESIKYLGLTFDKSGRSVAKLDRMTNLLTRVGRSPLKPRQKLDIVKLNVMPRLLHYWTLESSGKCFLQTADRKLRTFVIETLKLPWIVSADFINLPAKAGGLAIPSVAVEVPLRKINLISRMEGSRDPNVRACTKEPSMAKVVTSSMSDLGVSDLPVGTVNLKSKVLRRILIRHSGKEQGRGACDMGAGILPGGDQIPTCPVLFDPVWDDKVRKDFILMRCGLLNSREVQSRSHKAMTEADKLCRLCKLHSETNSHALSSCAHEGHKKNIVARHDKVVVTVADILENAGYEVRGKPGDESFNRPLEQDGNRISVPPDHPAVVHKPNGGRPQVDFYPDLIAVKHNRGYIVEVTVPYERDRGDGVTAPESYLLQRFTEKKNKYGDLTTLVAHRLGLESVTCVPIVIGARGGAIPMLSRVLRGLPGVKVKPTIRRLRVTAILGSLAVWRHFQMLGGSK